MAPANGAWFAWFAPWRCRTRPVRNPHGHIQLLHCYSRAEAALPPLWGSQGSVRHVPNPPRVLGPLGEEDHRLVTDVTS